MWRNIHSWAEVSPNCLHGGGLFGCGGGGGGGGGVGAFGLLTWGYGNSLLRSGRGATSPRRVVQAARNDELEGGLAHGSMTET